MSLARQAHCRHDTRHHVSGRLRHEALRDREANSKEDVYGDEQNTYAYHAGTTTR